MRRARVRSLLELEVKRKSVADIIQFERFLKKRPSRFIFRVAKVLRDKIKREQIFCEIFHFYIEIRPSEI